MHSAVIPARHRYPALPLAGQPGHEGSLRPGPLVLQTTSLNTPTPLPDPRLPFGRPPPQSNYPPATVRAVVSGRVRSSTKQGWYFTVGSARAETRASTPPTYATQVQPTINDRL